MYFSVSQLDWGKVTSLYLKSEWNVIQAVVKYRGCSVADLQELLPLAAETFSVVIEDTATVVLQCLTLIIPKVSISMYINF